MSPSSSGCQRRESGIIQIHLKLIGVRQLTNAYLGCLQEPRENLYMPAVEQSAQFTSPLITRVQTISENVFKEGDSCRGTQTMLMLSITQSSSA